MKMLFILSLAILCFIAINYADDFTYTKNEDGTITQSRVITEEQADVTLKLLLEKQRGLELTIKDYSRLLVDFQAELDEVNAQIAKIETAKVK